MRESTNRGYKLRDNSDFYNLEGIENYNTSKIDEDVQELFDQVQEAKEGLSNFTGSFETKAALDQYSGTKTKNDYAVVQSDETHNNQVSRYIYNGTAWVYQYKINEEPFTQAQTDALNSGINSTKVSSYNTHILNQDNPHNVSKEQIGLENVNNTSDANKPISIPQQAELDKKVDIAQGSQNAGKVLGIDNEGNVIPVNQQGGATPEQLATKLDKTKDIKKIEVVTELPKVRDLYTMYLVVEEEEEWPGLKFTSQQDDSTVAYRTTGTVDKDIYYSADGKNWTAWDGDSITLNNGESIYVWNKTNTLSSDSNSNYLSFIINGSVAASGNVNSMINFSGLTPNCFTYMFEYCDALTTAPYLPATQLANGCYANMFTNCTALTKAPDLPATTLAEDCYAGMFTGCTSLTTVPELPATQLANGCYNSMFAGCNSLTTAPELPATQLYYACYRAIFENTSINSIKLHYTGNFDLNYFDYWVNGVSLSGTLYYNGSDTTRGESAIPQNWAVQTF